MIKEQFFPTTIYGKDVQLDNGLLDKDRDWETTRDCLIPRLTGLTL